ncbi:hypothetical protein CCM_05561 [Cordyceps militaris CM01]|uniref:Uncharacterized protein n=1 Tax=Cordyceps militaris (strain CM01) TaxID=983644 RepID=G3JKB9_CORMM|nr:uncharacterized protein CCM_05561 [Cordyceps militaris CM01]EGX91403.1 hypothetical protein CCM_05561 [Cordyceps militaris CM01]
MDVSYDDIPLQVQVPVRVFSAQCDPLAAVIFFDFCGKPAQITISATAAPPQAHPSSSSSSGYEALRERLYALAQVLACKSRFYMAGPYIPVASQMEELLRDVMLDATPLPAPPMDWLGSYPLEWFLSMGRQPFLLTEDHRRGGGQACAVRDEAWPEHAPSAKDLQALLLPRALPALSTAHLKVAPVRCGRNRVSGTITADVPGLHQPYAGGGGGAHTYTFVCLRELGARAAADGSHRAMAYQIQQLELVAQACRGLTAEARQAVCVPTLRASLVHEFGAGAGGGRLPVGMLLDELPKLVPLRACTAAAPPGVVREWVLRICRTVDWLADMGIGWGGSFAADHRGHALLDAVVVDAFSRPWLMDGFADCGEGKILNDRIAAELLRGEYGLGGM